jgi:hypothetical protein
MLGACKKDNGPTRITVTVVMANQTVVSNAAIALLTDAHRIYSSPNEKKSGTDGQLYFDVDADQTFYLYHYNDGNIIGDSDATYITDGTFKSTDDIKYSARQTPAPNIGDTKYVDINGDGVIDKNDLVKKVTGPSSGQTVQVVFSLKAK